MRDFWFKLKMKYQKLTRGYSDIEIWNLDATIAEFVLPRMKALRDGTCCYPPDLNSLDEWKEMLDKMIRGFELYLVDDWPDDTEEMKKQNEEVGEALKMFGERFSQLWW